MSLWIIFACLTAAVLGFVLLPLFRRQSDLAGRKAYDLAVYRDQLAELERDRAAGLILQNDAEAARNELGRRMLAADAGESAAPQSGSASAAPAKVVMLAALVGIPAVALTAYTILGRPDLPDVPRQQRIADAVKNNDFTGMIAQVEAHLAKNPQDVQGWLVLAPAYRRIGRFTEAAQAMAKAVALSEPTPQLWTDYGEALVLAAKGIVTSNARTAFEKALKLDKNHVKAQFYHALAVKQEGDTEAALAEFKAILKKAPKTAAYRNAIERQIALIQPVAKAPALSKEQMESAKDMSTGDRMEMIRGMVDQLAGRLAENGKDLEGWLRLANARMVLGEKDKAVAALNSAAEQFRDDAGALRRIKDARTQHGLPESSQE